MKYRKFISCTIILLSTIFILTYLIDGILELLIPFKGLGFPYKSISFYFLKLFYSIIFLLGGVFLLNKDNRSWFFVMFSSIGILTNCYFIYNVGYLFRSTPLDYFFLETLSILTIIFFNIDFFIKKLDLYKPKKTWTTLSVFIIINFISNYISWWLMRNDFDLFFSTY